MGGLEVDWSDIQDTSSRVHFQMPNKKQRDTATATSRPVINITRIMNPFPRLNVRPRLTLAEKISNPCSGFVQQAIAPNFSSSSFRSSEDSNVLQKYLGCSIDMLRQWGNF